MKNKKGISAIIGYVILISIVLTLSGLVFVWVKNLAPTEARECKEGVSLSVVDYICNPNILNLTIKNNGRFNVGGYFIRGSKEENAEIAELVLSKYWRNTTNDINTTTGAILFVPKNSFNVSETREDIFDLSSGGLEFIQIVPLRYEKIGGREIIVSCSKAEIKRFEVSC